MKNVGKKFTPPGTALESHHIIPKHRGGTNVAANLVKISIRDHVIAHWLLWRIFGEEDDLTAFKFRTSTSEERRLLGIQKRDEYLQFLKDNGYSRFSKAYQSMMGKRGGKKGGKAGTQKQFDARQTVGKAHGRTAGISNQSEETTDFLKSYSIWNFKGYRLPDGAYVPKKNNLILPAGTIEENFNVLVGPKDAFMDVLRILLLFAPGSFKKGSQTQKMYALKNKNIKEGKVCSGWSLFKTLTRSEVEAGAIEQLPFEFFTENLNLE